MLLGSSWVQDKDSVFVNSLLTTVQITAVIPMMPTIRPRTFERALDVDERSTIRNDDLTVLTTYVPVWSTESSPFWFFSNTSRRVPHSARSVSFARLATNGAKCQMKNKWSKFLSPESHFAGSAKMATKVPSRFANSDKRSHVLGERDKSVRLSNGYAAFGLTVLPYTMMTLVNLIGNLLTPDYPTLYLVQSYILLEAQSRTGALFEGLVGKLVSVAGDFAPADGARGFRWRVIQGFGSITRTGDLIHQGPFHSGTFRFTPPPETSLQYRSTPSSRNAHGYDGDSNFKFMTTSDPEIVQACLRLERNHNPPPFLLKSLTADSIGASIQSVVLAATVVNLTIVGILGYLSQGFDPGDSTIAQRAWTMSWFAFGPVIGILFSMLLVQQSTSGDDFLTSLFERTTGPLISAHQLRPLIVACTYGSPALGGLVVIGQMLREYGSCIRF
ncbi:hypothetical protein DFH09DRAFT_1273229 [Mycena vulgaris]|nr:hypothetical protein DFH09DRAFT_1273229 [Mycena vulgaris]